VYQWDLPEDTAPLREAIRRLCANQFDVAIFTTSVQVTHLLRIAAEMNCEDTARAALRRMMIASIGPTTSETLAELGVPADFEPSHPKMGFLVNESGANAAHILASKERHA
jgi:uroporphyrinogen-III synthase